MHFDYAAIYDAYTTYSMWLDTLHKIMKRPSGKTRELYLNQIWPEVTFNCWTGCLMQNPYSFKVLLVLRLSKHLFYTSIICVLKGLITQNPKISFVPYSFSLSPILECSPLWSILSKNYLEFSCTYSNIKKL